MARTERKRGRTGKRVLRGLWIGVRALGIFVFVASIVATLALDLGPVRRWVVRRVDGVLESTFAGRVVIEKVDHLGLDGIRGARVRVQDPTGAQVLYLDGVSVRVALVSTLRSVLDSKGDRVIDLAEVKLGYIDANLDADPAGNLRLPSAFTPKNATPSAPSSRSTAIHVRQVRLDHAWLHGQPPGAPLVDADVDHLAAGAHLGSTETVDLTRMELTTRAMPQNANARLQFAASYAAPGERGQDRTARIDVRGDVGGIPLSIKASLDGPQVDAAIDVPKITPEMVAGLVPGTSTSEEASVHAEAHGRLPDLEANAHAALGRGIVDLHALLHLAEEKSVQATLTARDIDTHGFSTTAPSSHLGADATLGVHAHPRGDVDGNFTFDVAAGSVGTAAVPSAHFGGSLRGMTGQSRPTTMSVTGSGIVDEPGARTRIDFDARQADGKSTVGFDLATSVARLEETRVGPTAKGSAELAVRGTLVAAESTTIDLDADLRASKLAQADRHLERAWLRAHVRGPTSDPLIDALFQGRGLAVGNMRFATAALTTHGSLRKTDVTFGLSPIDAPKIDGRASVETGEATVVRNANVAFSRDDQRAVVAIRTLRSAGSDLRLEGLTIEGLGDPVRADAHKTSHNLILRASTNELDLSRVSRLFRLTKVQSGHVGIDVDLDVDRAAARGHARFDLANGQFDRVRNGTGHIEATFDGRTVDAVVHAKLGEVGNVDVDKCHIEVGGRGPLDASSWKTAWGTVALDSRLDLAHIRRLLPRGALPLTDLTGTLWLKGDVTRRTASDVVPDLHISAATRGLVMSGRGEAETVDGARVLETPPWSLEGVDVQFATSVAETTGATEVNAKVFDRQGVLTSLDARAPSMPYAEWLRGRPLTPERLGALRVSGQVVIPRRDLKKFPAVLKTQQFSGSVAGSIEMDGTLAEPDVHVALEAAKFASAVGAGSKPLDAILKGQYANGEGTLAIGVAGGETKLLDGEVHLNARVADLFGRESADGMSWRGSTHMRLSDFPLDTVGLFSDFQMKGLASGELTVDDLHENARAKVQIALRDLELGRARFPHGAAQAEYDGRLLRATVRLDQKDGYLQADAQAGMKWGRDPAPTPTTDVAAFASLKAERFRAAALLPFVTGAMSELDGRIDADARIDIRQGGGPPNMKGTVRFSDGLVQLSRVGDPLHGVNVKVDVTPDGLVRVDDLTAHGSTGTLNAKAIARLNGFDLVGASANLHIPHREPLPVDFDGQDIGDVDGDMSIRVNRSADHRLTNVTVDIPHLHTALPLSSSHSVQELGVAKGVQVGYFRRQKQFILLPQDAGDLKDEDETSTPATPGRTSVAIHLGDDVEIRRGTTLRVLLAGDPKIDMAQETRMSGQIRLRRGFVEVQGKRFEIEKGTVTFVGDEPSNPQVIVTAGWTAPDGTRVYADFQGPLKTGKVTLRSEPPRPQNEVLALILFGTAEGSSATPYATPQPSGATQAGTVAGGFVTEGLSKGLDELTGLEVSTKIDTTNSANPEPEIEVQIARDISFQIGYVIGTPPPGTNPDKTLLTLDWRFKRNWSMEATFGDQGSSIMDFVWRHRY